MNTLEELVFYCRESASLGALMLKGGWGCGKTHLIEHELKDALKDTHLVAHISMFGITSIEMLNRTVRKQWLAAVLPGGDKLEKHEETIKRSRELVRELMKNSIEFAGYFQPVLTKFKSLTNQSVDFYDFVPIQRKVKTHNGEREIVLVFDDLERTKLNIVDAIGCIDGYCTNYGFKVIIVANEDKIIYGTVSSSTKVVIVNGDQTRVNSPEINTEYLEIKEKTIRRTVSCKQDNKKILRSILAEDMSFNRKYQDFLKQNMRLIDSIFDVEHKDDADANVMVGFYNIRTLKRALVDFYRAYQCLEMNDLDNISFYLYAYIVFVMVVKTGRFHDEAELDGKIRQLFPMFNGRYLLPSVREWVLNGVWDEKRFEREAHLLFAGERTTAPKDKLRLNNILDMGENEIRDGFKPFLQDAYAGALTLDEYVAFIKNVSALRYYQMELPCAIDWDRVSDGIEVRFQRNIESNCEEGYVCQSIPKNHWDRFSPQELSAYDRIRQFRHRKRVLFENNRRIYLQELKENGARAFATCENLHFDCFDREMAMATAACYESRTQAAKHRFPIWFQICWDSLTSDPDVDRETSIDGLAALKERLNALCAAYREQGSPISARHTEKFIQIVVEMIAALNRTDEEQKSREESADGDEPV